MSNVTAGLGLLFQPATLLYVVLGLVIGFLVGLIPGMSAGNACAILLPFTLHVPLVHGLALMVAIYGGTTYSMAIPAIMLNIPTEAGAACTALDGYPMALKGRAAEAIGVARLASVTGGIIGIGAALLLLTPLASAALKFGPSELFLIAVIGIMIIGGLVGDSPVKGFLSGAMGFLIAAMGANPLTGVTRLSFGQVDLYDGVPFVPAVLGLFAITEMTYLARRARRGSLTSGPKITMRRGLGSITDGLRTTANHPGAVLRSGFLGLLMGLVPGIGHSVANYISYAFGKSRSKNPETWGTGNPEGVIASEGCDNAVSGGSMVPMLALGIPHSATTAVLLAALTLHGIQPGPNVLSSHGDLAYAVLFALFLANLLILPLGVLLALPMLMVTRVRLNILIPVVLTVAVVGSYASRQEVFDIGLTLVFAVIGIAMRAGGFPVIPMLIGIVLGPTAEQNFLLARNIGRGQASYFFSSAIDKVLAAILLGILLLFVRRAIRHRRGKTDVMQEGRQVAADLKPGGPTPTTTKGPAGAALSAERLDDQEPDDDQGEVRSARSRAGGRPPD